MNEVQIPDALRIPRVVVLNGHDSEGTAVLQENYLLSPTRHCRRLTWREHGAAGENKGQWRAVHRTTDPSTANMVWNRPKPTTYHELVLLYTDPRDPTGRVEAWSADHRPSPVAIHRARLSGLVEQMTPDDFATWTRLLRTSRTVQSMWMEWHRRLDAVTAYLVRHGRVPRITDDNMWQDHPDGPMPMPPGHLAVYVAVAMEQLKAQAAPQFRVHITVPGWVINYRLPDRTGTVWKLAEPEWEAAEWKADLRGEAVFPADSRDRLPDEVRVLTQAWLDRGARSDSLEESSVHQRAAVVDGWVLTYDRVNRRGSVTAAEEEAADTDGVGAAERYVAVWPWTVDERNVLDFPPGSNPSESARRAVERWLGRGAPHDPARQDGVA